MTTRVSTSTFPSQNVEDAGTPVSQVELDRLEAVRRYSVLDTPPEGAFDRITRLAAQLFDVPVAIISVIDHDRIWFKSAQGLPGITQIPREPGLCSTAIEGREPYVLENAAADALALQNSLVSGPFGLRFYIGVPLATSDGFNLGTLCVVDREARTAEPEKIEMLVSLAKIVVDELELRLAARRLAFEAVRREAAEVRGDEAERSSRTDALTGLPNRRALELMLDGLFEEFRRGERTPGSVAVIDVDGLKLVNDRRGHDAGDRFLRSFAAELATAFADRQLFRYGGDEFVLLSRTPLEALTVRQGVATAVRGVRENGFPEIDASFGLALFDDVDGSPRGALRLADSRMYATKATRRV
jgi:diguanylate cyclase (GGDEF)-like protein